MMSIESSGEQPGAVCPGCGGSDIGMAQVRSAFFHEDRLVVVEDIPALVCAGCNEQFYDDRTVVWLDLLRGAGFPTERARDELRVPVFSFRDCLMTEAET
ncbi:YgiT-type zinc finger protein [Bradyrhizobium sediminis]|uniref:YgiT-type zinc finger protein n=1 Tax=Bradyrhizobium sediminis TaxID=2840469 RepID=A0A975RLV8_9BRAD|nr:YgiT-type zinc finger protein [Bradyrhizobium sediminis]QWG12058.1 YgiT-type zinc finger protein [Bradyrhizobium sediminis]